MTLTILLQDDCAPDSLEVFDRKFKNIMFCHRKSFQKISKHNVQEISRESEWRLGCYVLSICAEDPFYRLEKIIDNET